MKNNKEAGFTLIELLTVMGITAILLTLSAGAIRHYWFVRSLSGGADQVQSQLREIQEETRSESHPLVYGAWFDVGASNWAIVRYDPLATPSPACTVVGRLSFDAGVVIESASFSADTDISPVCTAAVAGSQASEFAYFYARGTATDGDVTLVHPALSGKSRTITVTPMTGRVTSS